MTPAVLAERLTMRFGSFTAVDDISFSAERGEIFGFLGANGAGKTTTIRILCGLLEPSAGRVCIAGHDLKDGLDHVKRVVGYMSQRFSLYDDLTIAENLAFTASLRRMSADALKARTTELLGLAGFSSETGVLVGRLPPGVKQQVALANAMLHDPEVVFLDEPTAGVTPVSRARFWALIRRIAAAGKAIFVTTHYMDEAEQCGRIALMREGRIIALDSPAGLKAGAFPGPIIELDPAPNAPAGWREKFFSGAGIGKLVPHGLRWHIAPRDEKAWAVLARKLPASLKARPISPSLEDVFMRLVEGGDS